MSGSLRRRALASAVSAALRGRGEALLLGLAVLALGATFLRPTIAMQRPELELVVVLDVTQSMNVPDQRLDGKPVSRLAYAKAVLERALVALPCGAKLGWSFFTEYRSFLLMAPIEVCEHHRELRDTLRRIDGRMAWAGNSEVAKGLNSGLQIAHTLESRPALVFLTDGHEAPPVNPGYRPNFTVERGDVRGVILGVGGDAALPIPKIDPAGQRLGEWAADEVLQVDPRSLGRGGSVAGEQMVEPEERDVAPLPGATPGREHLSALREDYLMLLASETGLAYRRLDDAAGLVEAMQADALARTVASRLDLRPGLAALALFALLWPLLRASGVRTAIARRTTGRFGFTIRKRHFS
jgi:mxaL protein